MAFPTPMPFRVYGAPLSFVSASALLAPPRVFGKGLNAVIQAVPDRNTQPVSIQVAHFAAEVRTVIRPPSQNVKLPLMDHLVSQGGEQHAVRADVRCLDEWSGEPNETPLKHRPGVDASRARPFPTDEQPGRGGQPSAPFDGDWGERTLEIAEIQCMPELLQRVSRAIERPVP